MCHMSEFETSGAKILRLGSLYAISNALLEQIMVIKSLLTVPTIQYSSNHTILATFLQPGNWGKEHLSSFPQRHSFLGSSPLLPLLHSVFHLTAIAPLLSPSLFLPLHQRGQSKTTTIMGCRTLSLSSLPSTHYSSFSNFEWDIEERASERVCVC